jgi:hypothetical protein
MANAIDKNEPLPEELEDEENEDNEEEEGDPGEGHDTLVDSWETENGLIFELHGLDDHDEIIVVEEEEEIPGKDTDDHTVALALSLEDLDEAIDLLKEIREEMVKRQTTRRPAKPAKAKP